MKSLDTYDWPAPATNPESAVFYEAAAEHRLLYGKCNTCGAHHYYPRRSCPHCFSADVEWAEASGGGTVYSYTLTGEEGGRSVLAYIDLDEGVCMLSNIVDASASSLEVGARVRVVFGRAGEVKVPVFVLDEPRGAA